MFGFCSVLVCVRVGVYGGFVMCGVFLWVL